MYKSGDPRYTICFTNTNGNIVLEDSWIYGSKDDGVRVVSGKMAILRNTWELNGEIGGESLNCKSGAVGDVAYNVIMGAALTV